MTGAARAPLSVLIPTKNEERNIAACIASVAWAAEIVVFDSYSTDATLKIAEGAGARIVQRTFDAFATHKNWALDNIDFKHEWVLLLDADERITPPLQTEILEKIAAAGRDQGGAGDDKVGYYIARQTFFMGKWMRHVGIWPDYHLRLLRRGRGRFEDRVVHEHVILDGPAGYLENYLLHDDDKGLERYFDRHNHYSSLEAVEIVRRRAHPGRANIAADLRAKGAARRRALKNFAYRYLPARPLFVFLYMYVWKGGFLDGRTGFRYCVLRSFYEYQISLKLIELEQPDSPIRRKYAQFLD